MATAVRFNGADVRALNRALLTMEAERAAAEKWRVVSVELEEAMETVTELRDRMLAEQARVAGAAMLPTLPTVRPIVRPITSRVDMGAVRRLEDHSRRHTS